METKNQDSSVALILFHNLYCCREKVYKQGIDRLLDELEDVFRVFVRYTKAYKTKTAESLRLIYGDNREYSVEIEQVPYHDDEMISKYRI